MHLRKLHPQAPATPSGLSRIARLNRPMTPEPAGIPPCLSFLPGIKIVLFDIYGTLLTCGSGEVGAGSTFDPDSALQALSAAGFDPKNAGAGARAAGLLKHHVGAEHLIGKRSGVEYPEVDIREIWGSVLRELETECLIPVAGDPAGAAHRHAIERLALEYECRVNPAWPMPGLKKTIDELRSRGLALGIVSNAQFYTPLVFQALAGTSWNAFDRQLCVLSYELREAKPSSRLFETALARVAETHAHSASETLFVGNDMLNDITAAATAGCRTALFAGDRKSLRLRREEPRCAGVKPDAVVTSLTQLPGIL